MAYPGSHSLCQHGCGLGVHVVMVSGIGGGVDGWGWWVLLVGDVDGWLLWVVLMSGVGGWC